MAKQDFKIVKPKSIILRFMETLKMRHLGVLFILCSLAALTVPSIFTGNEIELSVDSTGYPSFYRDESITLTCTASGDADVIAVHLVAGAYTTDNKSSCAFDGFANAWTANNGLIAGVPGFSRIDQAYCEAAAAAPPFTFSITGIVSDDLLGVDFRCFADFLLIIESSASFSIPTINVKPENLVMNRPDQIIEEKEFTFNCTSTGGSPDSVYEYEVLRGNIVVVISNSYTPVIEDRVGLTLRCKDTTHSVLENIYPDNIIKSEDLEPRYIDYGEEPHYDLEHNPGGPLTLTCKVLTDSSSLPTYKWSCSTCSDTDQLVIDMDSRQNGQTEQFNCTASIESVGEIIITWNVTWTDAVTIPPTTQPTTTKSTASAGLTVGPIVGIVIGGVVLIAVVIIIILCCRKFKGTREGTKDTAHREVLTVRDQVTIHDTTNTVPVYERTIRDPTDHVYSVVNNSSESQTHHYANVEHTYEMTRRKSADHVYSLPH
ncbi:uncharacterized protein [Watersipora subatra]|uniref:uncharacterized protein isoform X2 n=1 Tax=Watersipora subatra TaxID=2589382 RepID=UPI00355BE7FF